MYLKNQAGTVASGEDKGKPKMISVKCSNWKVVTGKDKNGNPILEPKVFLIPAEKVNVPLFGSSEDDPESTIEDAIATLGHKDLAALLDTKKTTDAIQRGTNKLRNLKEENAKKEDGTLKSDDELIAEAIKLIETHSYEKGMLSPAQKRENYDRIRDMISSGELSGQALLDAIKRQVNL